MVNGWKNVVKGAKEMRISATLRGLWDKAFQEHGGASHRVDWSWSQSIKSHHTHRWIQGYNCCSQSGRCQRCLD